MHRSSHVDPSANFYQPCMTLCVSKMFSEMFPPPFHSSPIFPRAEKRASSSANKDLLTGYRIIIYTSTSTADFADDLALLSHGQHQMQNLTTVLRATSTQIGLKIHQEKTKILKINTSIPEPKSLKGNH